MKENKRLFKHYFMLIWMHPPKVNFIFNLVYTIGIIITYPSFIFSLVFTSIYIRTFEDKAMFFFSCNPCKCYSNRD